MSKPRKNSPPPPAEPASAAQPGDDDFELDDPGDRQQPRPQLPQQRKEQPMFEVAGQRTHRPMDSLGHTEVPKVEGRMDPVWQPASDEEIAGYDPSVETPADRPAPAKAPEQDAEFDAIAPARPEVRVETAAQLDDLDEFLAKTAQSGPEAPEARPRRPYSKLEWACMGGGMAALLAIFIWLYAAVTSGTAQNIRRSDPVPDLPLAGSLITVSEITSGWRVRKDTDRVARMEVYLPKPAEVLPELIPQIDFTVSGESQSGYLRFIFKDGDGKPRGDTRVVRIDGGKLANMENGEIINSATSGTVYSSNGIQDRISFLSYEGSDEPRWSVEVSESATYDAADQDWKFIALFDIRSAILK